MIKNWNLTVEYILKFLEVPKEYFPEFYIDYNERTRTTTDRETNEIIAIYFKLTNDEAYNLVSLFHECWHVHQLYKGLFNLKYKPEDVAKYCMTEHNMYMLFQYPFEVEAHSHAWMFGYYYYYLRQQLLKENANALIARYSVMDQGLETDFDTPEDAQKINLLLQTGYSNAKLFFESKLKEYIVDYELIADLPDEKKTVVSKLFELILLIEPAPPVNKK